MKPTQDGSAIYPFEESILFERALQSHDLRSDFFHAGVETQRAAESF
jgi:hypothetical protein